MTAAEVWARLPMWKRALLTAIDLLLGNGKTISERLALSRDQGQWRGRVGCSILDGIDPGHCDRARDFPVRR
jgi:hypothetical protein